jgi:hypothetical protein
VRDLRIYSDKSGAPEPIQKTLDAPLPCLQSLTCYMGDHPRFKLSPTCMNGAALSLVRLCLRHVYLPDTVPTFPSLQFLTLMAIDPDNDPQRLLRIKFSTAHPGSSISISITSWIARPQSSMMLHLFPISRVSTCREGLRWS